MKRRVISYGRGNVQEIRRYPGVSFKGKSIAKVCYTAAVVMYLIAAIVVLVAVLKYC